MTRKFLPVDGQLLSGIGALLAGVAAIGGFLWALMRGPRLAAYLQDKNVIITDRDHARILAAQAAERATAAELRAQNWEGAADGADREARLAVQRAKSLEERVSDLEKRDAERETERIHDRKLFANLIAYTRDLFS